MSILPQLEHDLFAAAERRLPALTGAAAVTSEANGGNTAPVGSPAPGPHPRLRRRARTTLAGVPIAASVLVAIAMAAIAVGIFGHTHRPSASGAPSRSAARAELLQSLSVLRRPQIAADRDPQLITSAFQMLGPPFGRVRVTPLRRKLIAQAGDPTPDRALLRVVSVPSLRAHILIAPTTYRPAGTSRQRIDGITVAATSPGNIMTGSGPGANTITSLRTHGLAIFFGMSGRTNPGVVLVPDGVATVRLSHVVPVAHDSPFTVNPHAITTAHDTPFAVNPHAIATALDALEATGHVTNNLAAFDLPVPTVTTRRRLAHFVTHSGAALVAIPVIARATWLTTSGQVIRHTTTPLDILIRVRNHPA